MEELELEKLSEELKTVEPSQEYDLEEILKEDFGDGQDAPGEPEREAEPPETAEEPFTLPPELSDEAAAREYPEGPQEEPPEDGDDDFADFMEEERPERPKRERRTRSVPEVPVETLAFLGILAVAAVLAGIAAAAKLEGAAWRVVMTLALIVACAPMALDGLDILSDRGRIPPCLVMIAACAVLALCGGVVEAVIAAIIFNLLGAVLDAFTGHELRLVYDRLEAAMEELGENERKRVDNQLREIAGKRLKPIVQERALDRMLLLGLLGVGVLIGGIVPLLSDAGFAVWIGRAAALLAVGIYCGETAAVMNALNGADSCVSQGIFFSGSGAAAAAAQVTSVLFSKSGTLTDGNYEVAGIDPVRLSEEQLLYLAAYAGAWSDHPLHAAVRRRAGFTPDRARVERHREKPGYGTVVMLDGLSIVAAGNIDFMEELGVKGDFYMPGKTCLFVAVGKTLVGRVDFEDTARADAAEAVKALRGEGVANVALMTGDNALSATTLGRGIGITEVYSDCRPGDKLSRLQYILDSQEPDDRLAFVSADIGDRELLEIANVGVGMGTLCEESAVFPDLVIASGKLATLPAAIGVAHALRRNSRLSFLISAAVRLVCAVLAVTGVLTLWSTATVMLLLEAALFFNTRVPDER